MMPVDAAALDKLIQSVNTPTVQVAYQTETIRQKAIKEAAMLYGSQAGLFWVSQVINHTLKDMASYLDRIFVFNRLMLPDHVLPPVLEQASNTVNVHGSNQKIRFVGQQYLIVKKASFASAAPNWREYLWMNYQMPEMPDASLLPKNNDEKQLWTNELLKAWSLGVDQGEAIFNIQMNTLVRDFNGMLLYRRLLLNNMVSLPYVKHVYSGITGDGDRMNVDDLTWQITKQPKLLDNAKLWQPVIAGLSKAGSQYAQCSR